MKNIAAEKFTGRQPVKNMKETKEGKMRIVMVKDKKEILRKKFSSLDESLGIISLERRGNATEFTVRVLDVNRLRYHYDPVTQKFVVHFLSLRKEFKGKKEGENESKEHACV